MGAYIAALLMLGSQAWDSCSGGLSPHTVDLVAMARLGEAEVESRRASRNHQDVDRIRVVPVKACAVRLLFPASLMPSRVLAL